MQFNIPEALPNEFQSKDAEQSDVDAETVVESVIATKQEDAQLESDYDLMPISQVIEAQDPKNQQTASFYPAPPPQT